MTNGVEPGGLDEGRQTSRAYLAATLVLVTIGLAWAYASSLAWLIDRWSRDDNYSHGFLVLPIAGAILWRRLARRGVGPITPSWWGVAGLAAVLAARTWLFERDERWFEAATIPLAVACVTLAAGGWGLLARAWPAVAFSCFMIPLPGPLNAALGGPLQSLATAGSVSLLRAGGLPVIAEGNVILVGGERLEVARACNGLSMLLSFATLVAAMIALTPRPLRERVALPLAIVPVALACNVLRIVATGWAAHLAGRTVEEAHDWAGLAMMPVALGMLWLGLRALSWIVVEVDEYPGPNLVVGGPDRPRAVDIPGC